MKYQKNKLSLAKFILSLGGVGFVKFAPGTWGSALSLLPLYFAAKLPLLGFIFLCLSLFLIGCILAQWVEKALCLHDPSWIVFDELIGLFVTWCFIFEWGFYPVLFALILFRIFDILKPWPIGWIDQKVSGGLGTMLDDVIAGLFAGVFFLVTKKIFLAIDLSFLFS